MPRKVRKPRKEMSAAWRYKMARRKKKKKKKTEKKPEKKKAPQYAAWCDYHKRDMTDAYIKAKGCAERGCARLVMLDGRTGANG